jgi:hypothetical protein
MVMNEHLNVLRLKAGISRLENDQRLVVINKEGNVINPLIGLEKFAQLVVEKCLDLCEDERDIFAIKEHFGVE